MSFRTDGGYGVPGMPGNFPTNFGNLIAGSPSFTIGPRSPFKGMSREQLEELKKFDDRPQDLQQYYDRINNPGPQLPMAYESSNFPGEVGNMGGLIAQALPKPLQPTPMPGAKYTLKQLIGDRPGIMSDIPEDVRFRQDTQLLPFDPGNYAQNNKQNPLRGNRWAAPFNPRGYVGPGIAPYFGNRQGPGLYGEMGTGAI